MPGTDPPRLFFCLFLFFNCPAVLLLLQKDALNAGKFARTAVFIFFGCRAEASEEKFCHGLAEGTGESRTVDTGVGIQMPAAVTVTVEAGFAADTAGRKIPADVNDTFGPVHGGDFEILVILFCIYLFH